jgi:hypothetical protein
MTPVPYPAGTPLVGRVRAADYLALAGVFVAFAFAIYRGVRGPFDPISIAALLFTAMGLVLQCTGRTQNVPGGAAVYVALMRSVYDFGRVHTPLLLCVAVIAAQRRNAWLLAPIAMMLPRIAILLTPQFLGIVRWIA